MDMELADYQRAADTLQEKLTAVCIMALYHIVLLTLGITTWYYRARIRCQWLF